MIPLDEPQRLVEASLYDYEPGWLPPGCHVVARPDLLMWSSPSPSRGANRVAWVKWTEQEVERGIDEVFAYYRARGRDFSWCIGPSSTPAGLGAHLGARGLACVDASRMLTAPLPISGMRVNPDVRIEEVHDRAGVVAFVEVTRATHDDWAAEDHRAAVAERLSYIRFPGRRGGYLVARLGGKVVANAAWRDSADGRCVYLSSAHTLPEFRNRGVYSALLVYRTDRAYQRGCRYAATRADPETSAPILLKRGFSDHGPLPVFGRPVTGKRPSCVRPSSTVNR